MSFCKVNKTTGELEQCAGLVNSDVLNSMSAAFPSTASSTNKLATNADINTALDNKVDKVSSATSGNFAGLNASGNLTDSGKKASDFVQSISVNGVAQTITGGATDLEIASNLITEAQWTSLSTLYAI